MSTNYDDDDGDGVGLIFVVGVCVFLVAMIVLYSIGICT